MSLIIRIAWRNIFRHKAKTIVIGTILFIGALIMTIGNGVISGMNEGMRKNIVESFSGHAVLISEKQIEESALASMSGQTLEPITNYLEIKDTILSYPNIKAILPAGVGYVWVLNESGQPIDQYLLGVDFEQYQPFFNDTLEVVEGRLLAPYEKGVLVSTTMRNFLFDFSGKWIIPKGGKIIEENLSKAAKENPHRITTKESVVFMGLSRKNASLDIMADAIGIVKFKQLNSVLGFYSIVDIESLRECMGYFSAEDTAELSSTDQQLMDDSVDFDTLLDTSVDIAQNEKITLSKDLFKPEEKIKPTLDIEAGVYNVLFVKLKTGRNLAGQIKALNTYLQENELGLKAVPWNKAIGILGQFAVVMKGALFMFVCFIFFVAIIIIMNTLSMAAMERISEIGMMRAIGAKKRFIAGMFFAETMALSATFGGAGILLGIIIIKILASFEWTTKKEFLQIFFGGDVFSPLLSLGDIGICILQLLFVTVIAVIYPIIVSRRITPLDAIV